MARDPERLQLSLARRDAPPLVADAINYSLKELPRAFVPAVVHAERDPQRTLQPLWRVRDFAAEGWVEDAGSGGVNGPGIVSARWRGTRLKLHAAMIGAGWVIVTEAAWKGWQATVDGKRVRVNVGDHAFVAIRVPQGEHEIALVYRPQAFIVGSWISGISLLLVLVAAMAIRVPARP